MPARFSHLFVPNRRSRSRSHPRGGNGRRAGSGTLLVCGSGADRDLIGDLHAIEARCNASTDRGTEPMARRALGASDLLHGSFDTSMDRCRSGQASRVVQPGRRMAVILARSLSAMPPRRLPGNDSAFDPCPRIDPAHRTLDVRLGSPQPPGREVAGQVARSNRLFRSIPGRGGRWFARNVGPAAGAFGMAAGRRRRPVRRVTRAMTHELR